MSATQAAWKRGLWWVGPGLVLLGMLMAGIQSANAAVNCSGGNPAIDSEESNLIGLINAYRQANGGGALSGNQVLNQAAAWMANDLGTNGYFSHTDSLGRSPYARAIDCGYGAGAGENLAAGANWSSAQDIFDAWKASPGHNSNMLAAYYVHIGVARENVPGSAYGWYWVANFGANGSGGGGGSTPSPTPTNTPTTMPTNTPTPTPSGSATPTPTAGAATPSPTPTVGTSQPTATAPVGPQSVAPPGQQGVAVRVNLRQGANLVTWTGAGVAATSAGITGETRFVVYGYDPVTRSWQRFAMGLPPYLNTLQRLEQGTAYWFVATHAGVVQLGP